MARLLGHRQTKGTETDKLNLRLPRHISTLHEHIAGTGACHRAAMGTGGRFSRPDWKSRGNLVARTGVDRVCRGFNTSPASRQGGEIRRAAFPRLRGNRRGDRDRQQVLRACGVLKRLSAGLTLHRRNPWARQIGVVSLRQVCIAKSVVPLAPSSTSSDSYSPSRNLRLSCGGMSYVVIVPSIHGVANDDVNSNALIAYLRWSLRH